MSTIEETHPHVPAGPCNDGGYGTTPLLLAAYRPNAQIRPFAEHQRLDRVCLPGAVHWTWWKLRRWEQIRISKSEPVVVTPGYYMLVSANVNYAVNRSTNGGRAIIWPIATGYNDSRLYNNDESVIRLYTSRELLTAREPVGD